MRRELVNMFGVLELINEINGGRELLVMRVIMAQQQQEIDADLSLQIPKNGCRSITLDTG